MAISLAIRQFVWEKNEDRKENNSNAFIRQRLEYTY